MKRSARDSRKTILCRCTLPLATLRSWPEVELLTEESGRQQIVTQDAETVLRKLLGADSAVRDIEVKRAGLTEAFAELTSSENLQ